MARKSNSQFLMCLCFLFAILVPLVSPTFAQKAPTGSRNKELRKIDSKATKVDELFIRNAFEMANEYEEAGDVARAVEYLHAMSLVKPGISQIEGKLEQLRAKVLAANVFSFEHEPSPGWGDPVAFVKAGKPFRVDVKGEYRLLINATVGGDGFPENEDQSKLKELTQLIENAPLGKLVGVIVEKPNQPRKKGAKRILPFEIGSGRDIKPKQTGFLFLKVNLPQQSTTSGALQVQLSGYVLAPDGQNIGN